MRVLVVGAGGVGSAVARTVARRDLFERVVVADYDVGRAQRAIAGGGDRFAAAQLDASDEQAIAELIRTERCDAVLNAVDPRFVMPVFRAAFTAGVTYLDMAMSLSRPHASDPYRQPGVKLGDEQFALAGNGSAAGCWRCAASASSRGCRTCSPATRQTGCSRPSTRSASATARTWWSRGMSSPRRFPSGRRSRSCLNPPVVWERGRQWYTTEPFSEPEIFTFPAGIGPVECVDLEHEEVLLIPRWIDAGRVTFKYGLGEEFIGVLKTLHKLGLDSTAPVQVGAAAVAPRDVVAACLPDPAALGSAMSGLTCAGTWVSGTGKDGSPREVYLYHVVDNSWSMAEYGSQAVVWQTAVNPVVALELLDSGAWSGAGVLGPEALPPGPFLDLLNSHGAPWECEDRTPG